MGSEDHSSQQNGKAINRTWEQSNNILIPICHNHISSWDSTLLLFVIHIVCSCTGLHSSLQSTQHQMQSAQPKYCKAAKSVLCHIWTTPSPQETLTFTKLKQTKVTVTIQQDRAILIINSVKYSCLISSIWSHKMIQIHGTQTSEGHSTKGEIHWPQLPIRKSFCLISLISQLLFCIFALFCLPEKYCHCNVL